MCYTGPGASTNYNTVISGISNSDKVFAIADETPGNIVCGTSTSGTSGTSTRPHFRFGVSVIDQSTIPNELNLLTTAHSFENHPFAIVQPGYQNTKMLRVAVKMTGNLNPDSLVSMTFLAKGANTSSVSAAKLYYTGDSDVFSTNNLLQTLTAPTVNLYSFGT